MANPYDDVVANYAGAQPAPAGDNPYDAVVEDIAARQQTRARTVYEKSLATNPDQAAETQRLAKQTGLPADTVERNLDDVRRKEQARLLDLARMAQESPVLARQLADAGFTKQAHDDLGVLEQVEQFFRNTGRATKAGVFNASKGAAGVFRAGFELVAPALDPLESVTAIGGNPLRRLAEGFAMQAEAAGDTAKAAAPKAEGNLASGYYSGIQSLTQNLLALPMAFAPGGQGAALSMMTATTGGQSYQDAREKGLSMSQALPFAASQAAIEYATEKLPLSQLIGDVKAGTSFFKTLAKQAMLEVPGEQIATVLQDMNEWAVLNPEKPFKDYLAERPDAAAQTLVATIVGTGGNVTVVKGMQAAVDKLTGTAHEVTLAETGADQLQAALQTATQSKLRERNPEQFRALMQQMVENTDGAPQEIYLDAEVLNQLPADVLQALPENVLAQMADALAANDVVSIPVADVLTAAPGTALEQALIENARIGDPMAMTQAEAKVAGEQAQQYLAQEAERVIAQANDVQALQASSDRVKQGLVDQLNTAGRFSPAVNEAYATWTTAFYTTMAGRLGISPEEMAGKYPLRIGVQGADGSVLLGQPARPRSEEFRKFIKYSRVKSVVYHATSKDFDTFNTELSDLGAHFGTEDQANKIAGGMRLSNAEGTQILPVWLNIRNPLRLKDVGTFHADGIADQLERKGLLPKGEGKRIIKEIDADWKLRKKYDPMLRDIIREAGYDGVVYANTHEGTGDSYIAFDPTQIKSAIGNSGAFDPNDPNILNQGARATFNPETLELVLNENADLSSFLHETGHFFLEVMADLSSQADAPAEIQQDMAALLKWFGVADLQTWNSYDLDQKRKYHERFAESFEQYLLEGKAPSLELQPLFRKFKRWMENVYTSLKSFIARHPDSGIVLSPEIRQVFDRMLATREQIAQAEEVAGMVPNEDATEAAVEKLTARSLRDLKWTVNARAREIKKLQKQAAELRKGVEAEVRAEVEQQPIYRAMRWLKKGETTNEAGEQIKAEKGFRLNTGALAEMFPETMLARPDLTRLKGMTGKDGLHPDMVADMFGFDSGEALVRSLIDAEAMASVIEGMTDQRMLERHGDLVDDRAIAEAANEAVHNEARARALATELKTQVDALGARTDTGETNAAGSKVTVSVIAEAAKQFAANVVARTPIRDLKSRAWQHVAAERRAGKRWQEATAKGETQEAIKAKQDQVLNNAAAKAAGEAQVEMRKILDFFKRVVKDNNEKTVEKGRDPDVVNAARAVLVAYGVAPRAGKSALEYMEVLQKNDPAMFNALQPSVQGALQMAQPLEALTMDELRSLHDEIQGMWYMARRSRQMEVDGNLMDLEESADLLHARMVEIGIPDEIPGERGSITEAEERGIKLQFAKSILRRVEQWSESLDGKFGGPFLRFVFQPIKAAADRYRTDKVKYRERLTELVKGIADKMPPGPIAAPELGYTFGNGKDSGTAELLHALLHTGNDSNKRKLLLGRQWATENPDGTLDTSRWDAFLQRMHDSGTITKEHWDFAQGVWDLLEEMKPLAQKTHRDVYGRYFAEVTANPVATPFGEYRGGYVPAQTDSRLVKDAKLRELAEGENDSMAYAFPAAPSGFTKARVEYNQPLLLDLRALGQHMDKVLLFSHMQGAVTDVRRLLTRKNVSYGLNRIDPGAYEAMLIPWLNRAAKQIVETPVAGDRKLSRFLSAARSRAGMALMLGNVSNTIQQITGFSMAAVKVKPGLLMKSSAQFIAHPKQMRTAVAEASAFMQNRMLNEVAAMNDAVEQILVNPSLLERGQAWTQHHAYFLQTAMANTMEPIIWTAAYNQAVEQGMSEHEATKFADGTIRQTQGSTLPEDISRFESGPAYGRLFTQFVGYFNMMANTNATAAKQITDELGLKKGAGKLLYVALAGMLAPIWVAETIAVAMRGGPGDEDDDGYLDDWLAAVFGIGTLRGMVAQVPIVGQAAQMVASRFNDNPADDKFSLSPAVSLIESSVGAPASVYKAIMEDGSAMKATKDVAAAATMLTGLPFFAVARPVGYAVGVAEGRVEPTSAADAVRGAISGTASKESKQP